MSSERKKGKSKGCETRFSSSCRTHKEQWDTYVATHIENQFPRRQQNEIGRQEGVRWRFSGNCQRLEITLSGRVWQEIEKWLYFQQVQSVSVERATLPPPSSFASPCASSFRFLNCKLFDRKPKAPACPLGNKTIPIYNYDGSQ